MRIAWGCWGKGCLEGGALGRDLSGPVHFGSNFRREQRFHAYTGGATVPHTFRGQRSHAHTGATETLQHVPFGASSKGRRRRLHAGLAAEAGLVQELSCGTPVI